MIKLLRSLFRIATEDTDDGTHTPAPTPQVEPHLHDPFIAAHTEQVRQQEQWLESVSASNAAQQAIDDAAHGRHEG